MHFFNFVPQLNKFLATGLVAFDLGTENILTLPYHVPSFKSNYIYVLFSPMLHKSAFGKQRLKFKKAMSPQKNLKI